MDEAAAVPSESRKKIVDSFASIGVKATDLANYLGHPIDQCSPIELADLRGIYGCIQDEEATWKSFVDQKLNNDPGDKKSFPPEEFNASQKKWASVIQTGKRTPDEIIATLNARYALTEEQKKTIQNLKANGEAS